MRGRQLVLEGAALQGREDGVDVGQQNVGGAAELHGEAGIEHVGRGHALMDKARLRADVLGEVGQKGDDVVLRLALDLVDARDLEGSPLPHRPRRFLGITPSSAWASQACASISSQMRKRVSGVQIAAISLRL